MEFDKRDVLLSFILPVYNVEEYLRDCVESILSQITDECEIILVDDGATDSSGEICRQYAENSALIKDVHKENGGLSSARNAGLALAEGKYVTFVDSDDLIFPDSVSAILQWIKTECADICFLRAVKLFPDGTRTDLNEGIVRSELYKQPREKAVENLASKPKYPGSAWAKLFRRDFLNDNELHFPLDRRFSEDLGFIRDCLLCADSFDALEVNYYLYRQNRKGSITYSVSSKNFYDLLRFVTESVDKMTVDKKAVDPVSASVMSFVAYEYSVLLYLFDRIAKKDRTASLSELKKYRWVLRYGKSRKVKIIYIICTLLGVRITSFLTMRYRKRQR